MSETLWTDIQRSNNDPKNTFNIIYWHILTYIHIHIHIYNSKQNRLFVRHAARINEVSHCIEHRTCPSPQLRPRCWCITRSPWFRFRLCSSKNCRNYSGNTSPSSPVLIYHRQYLHRFVAAWTMTNLIAKSLRDVPPTDQEHRGHGRWILLYRCRQSLQTEGSPIWQRYCKKYVVDGIMSFFD